MNLADAIRQAALKGGPFNDPPEATTATILTSAAVPARPEAAVESSLEAGTETVPSIPTPTSEPAPPSLRVAQDEDEPGTRGGTGNVVRLELFLSPDQLRNVFGAIVSTQHTVLTLREAAAYLRVSAAALEQMANEQQIPAFMIDGKWRFSRAAVDEWLACQGHTKEKEA